MFALVPPVLYRIMNIGVLVLLLGGLFFCSLSLFWREFGRRLRGALTALAALALVLALALSVLMARQAWFNPPPADRTMTVIVLGSRINGDRPSLMLARRLGAAAEYLKKHDGAVCVVSGGQGRDEQFTEAQVMAAYLEELGVDPARVFQEGASTNTRENLSFSLAIMQSEGICGDHPEAAIATDAFHQLRASIFSSSLGIESYSLPSGTPWGLLPSYWARELIALPVAWFQAR